jgi:peptide deformylase
MACAREIRSKEIRAMIRSLVQLNENEIKSTSTPLRMKCVEVTDFGASLSSLIDDLTDTLLAHDIAIGLAAPQIGVNLRVAVINISEGKKEPTLIIINPRDVSVSGKKDIKRESCMSVPRFGGVVERRVNVRFLCEDKTGQTRTVEAHGFLARVYCHEIDHLDGWLYVDRMKSGVVLEKVDFFPE